MSKSKRKLSRKFRRTVGISLAVFFLIAAVVVAFLPQKDINAYTPVGEVYLEESENTVPKIEATDTIYTTGDGLFQFAYVNNNSGVKVAVICGFDFERSLPGGNLTIPDTVDAYLKEYNSGGTNYGYVAVSMSNEPLYYKTYVDQDSYEFVLDENGQKIPLLDENGAITYETDDNGQILLDSNNNPIQAFKKELKTIKVFKDYSPCTYNSIDKWCIDENGDGDEDELFYLDGSDYKLCLDDVHKRMKNASVKYIANQSATATATGWDIEDYDTAKGGIFTRAQNIVNLTIGNDLIGVGNNAFKGCSSLASVQFGDGLNTLGNYSFADCINLNSVTIPGNANMPVIGEGAFYNCQGLKSFSLPIGVKKIGDSCFEKCSSLEECILDIPGKNMLLKTVGNNAFKDCVSLKEIEFPNSFTNERVDSNGNATYPDLDISIFEGCKSLKHITMSNPNMKMSDSSTFSFEDFKDQLPEEFYFEGVKDKELHEQATANSIAFKYLNEEIYEKVTQEDTSNDKTKVVFRVNNQNELVYFSMGEDVTIVNIPNKIGPYGITSIGSDSFANNCSLKKVTIPSNITEIQAGAFKGCHNLTDVIFTEPINVSFIGEGAFDTQITGPECKDGGPGTTASLTFTGAARKGSAPFEYAMNPNNNINNGTQPEAYITFYTGWPTNFTVKYNSTTGENELIEVPTRSNINTSDFKDRAYMSLENQTAAAAVYNLINNDNVPDDSTPQNVKDFYYAVKKPVLPDGITSIKEGLFSGLDKDGNPATGMAVNNDIFSIEMSGVKKIDPYTFKNCDELANVKIHGACTSLGDYAFEDCDNLASVVIDSELSEFGRVPFVSSRNLTHVDFGNNPNFVCKDSIIYSTVNGVCDSVLEVLASRTGGIIFDGDLASVSSVKEEAFRDCDEIKSVDFTQCKVTVIPKRCFEDTDKLYEVKLNKNNSFIDEEAFKDSGLGKISIPKNTQIASNAFDGVSGADFVVEEGSPADTFAQNHKGIVGNIIYVLPTYTVVFNYMTDPADESTMKTVEFNFVEEGTDATKLFDIDTVPLPADWVFVGWDREKELKNVTSDITTNAKYSKVDEVYWTLTFIDSYYNEGDKGYIFYTDTVKNGEDYDAANGINRVQQPDHMKEGREFKGWKGEKGYNNVTENRSFLAQYDKFDPTATFTVTFIDWDDKVLYTQEVKAGEDCIEPKDPKREGYTFTGWRPGIKKITKDTTVYAQYEKIEEQKPDNPDNPDKPDNPDDKPDDKPDDGGNNGDNSNNGDNNNNNNNNNNSNTNKNMYTVTVVDGTGSGSYIEGANVIILANNPESGKVFDKWVVDEGVKLVKDDLAANQFLMPAKNVTVKATYKEDTSKKNNNNNSNNNSGSTQSNTVTPNTTVSLSKTGFSNGNLASASVTGSSDNYVLKITDSQAAKAEIEDALLAKYDSLDNIKYVAMDISLYDKTGSSKIENTSDLKVNITLPIPDDLVPYAGNNRIAYVVNGKLVDLNPKFTTINNVPCINFTATHFSPYTIYVDTNNLSSSVTYTSTSTPKTGDGLSVKWYISIGLFAASIIFFALCIPTGKKKKAVKR